MAENVRLVEPSIEFKEAYVEMIAEWIEAGEKMVPFVLRMDTADFDGMLTELAGFKKGIGIPETFVPHTTYWLADENDRIVGCINIRHNLNDRLLKIGGHIGYGVRPSARRKGYASAMLRLALEKAKEMELKKVLVTCNKDNIASAKTIINNGGNLESEYKEESGNIVQRYWIDNYK
ncbi:GNAT family N-acetyltransferase [Lederbergia citrea]|uniref:GNAT family N-acetyltransferase n=1 Tax=Lederbergia citrea TaxID=2833581 RepID=A0A942USP4_9BACI|nr:GNAT family N-acetyltransferase [Lederbergia citrea]MBS4205322.1 GNAT family N-acetyltransferase [Lederbergia citrea]MBS4224366.1 GNAT family N-acetyltransferase [Lederbergia citrea]